MKIRDQIFLLSIAVAIGLTTIIFYIKLRSLFKTEVSETQTVIIGIEEDEKNDPLVQLTFLLDRYNISHKEIVIAQAILESGNFTSNLYLNKNNLFGMKHPLQRPTTSLGGVRFASYESIDHCIIDYGIWQAKYGSNLTHDQYLELLSSIYAEDKEYVKKLKKIMNKKNKPCLN